MTEVEKARQFRQSVTVHGPPAHPVHICRSLLHSFVMSRFPLLSPGDSSNTPSAH